MFTDIFGTERLKVGLHMHTTVSDGRRTPEEAAEGTAAYLTVRLLMLARCADVER